MDIQRKETEEFLPTDAMASISLNKDGKINIVLEKSELVRAIQDILVLKKPCPPYALLCAHFRIPLECRHLRLPIDIRDVFVMLDAGILNERDFTVEQFAAIKSIRG